MGAVSYTHLDEFFFIHMVRGTEVPPAVAVLWNTWLQNFSHLGTCSGHLYEMPFLVPNRLDQRRKDIFLPILRNPTV